MCWGRLPRSCSGLCLRISLADALVDLHRRSPVHFIGNVGIDIQPSRFNYTTLESLMLCGFLSFLAATAAQTVNFFVQKNLMFKSNAEFGAAVPKFITLAVVLVILLTYSQALFISAEVPEGLAHTLANTVNILMQVVISCPAMKLWVMPLMLHYE